MHRFLMLTGILPLDLENSKEIPAPAERMEGMSESISAGVVGDSVR
jgi:hypothetical protein